MLFITYEWKSNACTLKPSLRFIQIWQCFDCHICQCGSLARVTENSQAWLDCALQWNQSARKSVGFCVEPVSEHWNRMVRRQPAIQPSFIASRFMLLVSLWRSHTWKGQISHLIQPNVPLLTPVQQARHQGACDSQHLNNAIVPTDRQTDSNTHTHTHKG